MIASRTLSFCILFSVPLINAAAEGTHLQTVPLFPMDGRAIERNGSWSRLYRSEPIDPMPMGIVSAATEYIQIPGWNIDWGESPRQRRDDAPYCLSALVRYSGELPVDAKTFLEISPRVLPVPMRVARLRELPPPQPRNVVILLIDALRPDHLPEEKHSFVIAPHLSLIGTLGIRFETSYGASSSTRPSVGSIFTGLHPRIHGATKHTPSAAALHQRCKLMAETFAEQGFQTAAFWTNSQLSPAFGFDRGFQTYIGPLDDEAITPQAVEWLRTAQEPFFLYLHYLAPHAPYDPPSELEQLYRDKTGDSEHNRYFAEITVEDTRVGGFLAELARLKMLDRTALILLSDHGEEFWEHGWKEHGVTLYEESLRTVARWMNVPRFTPSGIVADPVTHVDIFPTLCEWFRLPCPALWDTATAAEAMGKSLLPLLDGRHEKAFESRTLFGHHNGGAEPGKHESDKQGIIRNHRKLIWWPIKKIWELYDLVADPAEKQNLVSDNHEPNDPLWHELQSQLKQIDSLGAMMAEDSGPAGELSQDEIENMKALGYL